MLDTLKTLLANQFDAALCTLNVCVERCPETAWDGRVANMQFCQLAFHTLFFADFYLGTDGEGEHDAFRAQPFHRENSAMFRDYEEFAPRAQVLLYERPWIRRYVQHCRTKATAAIAAETAESFAAPAGFAGRGFSRAELYVYNTRHVQHHAAQLSLRLRLDHGIDVPWVGSGWREF
jgi:hypothetical protein